MKVMELSSDDPRTIQQAADVEVRGFKTMTSEDFVYDVVPLPGDAGWNKGWPFTCFFASSAAPAIFGGEAAKAGKTGLN